MRLCGYITKKNPYIRYVFRLSQRNNLDKTNKADFSQFFIATSGTLQHTRVFYGSDTGHTHINIIQFHVQGQTFRYLTHTHFRHHRLNLKYPHRPPGFSPWLQNEKTRFYKTKTQARAKSGKSY